MSTITKPTQSILDERSQMSLPSSPIGSPPPKGSFPSEPPPSQEPIPLPSESQPTPHPIQPPPHPIQPPDPTPPDLTDTPSSPSPLPSDPPHVSEPPSLVRVPPATIKGPPPGQPATNTKRQTQQHHKPPIRQQQPRPQRRSFGAPAPNFKHTNR